MTPRKPTKLKELPEISNPLCFVAIVAYKSHKPPKLYYTRNPEALERFVILERATDETIRSIDLALIAKTYEGVTE